MQTIYIHSFTSKATSQLIKCQISADSVPQLHDFTLHNRTIISPNNGTTSSIKSVVSAKLSPTPLHQGVWSSSFVNNALGFSPDKGGIQKRWSISSYFHKWLPDGDAARSGLPGTAAGLHDYWLFHGQEPHHWHMLTPGPLHSS